VVFDGKDRKSYTTAIDNVGLERDFNRVEIEGLEADAFEKVMASFEGQVAPALDRIIAAGAIQSDEDRFALVNLICALSLRNPRLRETIRDFHERVAKQMLGLMLQTPERWAAQLEKIRQNGSVKDPASVSHEDMKKFARGDKWKVTVPHRPAHPARASNLRETLAILFKAQLARSARTEKLGRICNLGPPGCPHLVGSRNAPRILSSRLWSSRHRCSISRVHSNGCCGRFRR
jgi:Protein of unknown function (DUF4238)